MDLKALQAQRMTLRTQATDALEEIRKNTDEARTAELEKRHDDIMGEFDKIDAKIDRELEHESRMKRFDDREESRERRQREQRRPGGDVDVRGEDLGDDDQVTYRAAFGAYLANAGNVAMLSPEQRSVLQTGYQTVEKGEQRAQTTTAAAGGYTVPEEMMPRLIKKLAQMGPMLDPDFVFEMVTASGVAMPFPTVDDVANESMVVQDTEGATLTDDAGSDVVFGEKQLEAYGYNTEWIRVSLALAQDSALAMQGVIIDLLGDRLARKGNTLLTTGDGTGDPNGVITAASTGVTAASATAIVFDELIDLEHSIDSAYREGASYMLKDATLKVIRKLKNSDGDYIWQAGNVQAGVPNMLNGYRYRVNPAMATIAASAKTIAFGDFKKYFVRKVGQPLIAAIQDKDFWPGFGVAGYWRIDGELADTAGIKLLAQAAS